jgi:hypothetical protein
MDQSSPHVPTARLLAVAMSEDILITPEEFEHLNQCKDCLERWRECIEKAGRHFEQEG